MKFLIPAVAAGVLALSATFASANPAIGAAKGSEGLRTTHVPTLEQADYRDRKRMLRKRDRHWDRGWRRGHRHWDDRRYRKYRGWNRYYSRPYGWRDRGCIAIGPIWFCP